MLYSPALNLNKPLGVDQNKQNNEYQKIKQFQEANFHASKLMQFLKFQFQKHTQGAKNLF